MESKPKGETGVSSSLFAGQNLASRRGDTLIPLRLEVVTRAFLPVLLAVELTFALTVRCDAQTPDQPSAQNARLEKPAGSSSDATAPNVETSGKVLAAPAQPRVPAEITPAEITKELELMKARIEQLEEELKARSSAPSSAAADGASVTGPTLTPADARPEATVVQPQSEAAPAPAKAEKPQPALPFAYADWTWLNGTPRNKDTVWDSKFFTPEVRFDTNFISSFNHPKDDSLGGSTEIFRSNEIQVEQISVGGDLHWQNVRGRILTMGGMFGVTTPRNDASVGRGQWDLRGAYKYFAEAYGGYHFNVSHGLNVDAGIFVSYIGLFSYYNFDNWAYQPSYVSSNTPWFFDGLRIQWFPTDKLKIEPWIINGWQSYGRFGNHPGLGGQILWRPKPWVSLVFNNYGMGEDTLGNIGRSRIHTDDSIEIKYYDHPEKTLDKMAFSLTGDLGCEYGGGVSCHHKEPINGTKGGPQQSFAGWMLYNRWWFKKDLYALTLGGGAFDNPGRYLTLLQPINGADAVSGSPYFPEAPGLPFKAWDTSITFDYMPKQYITFLWEFGYRHANEPYFTGRGGITPPGGNNGFPAQYACNDGTPGGTILTSATCATDGGVWFPDLRKDEPSLRMAVMVKF
jgi:hypothetical protein